MGNVTTLTRPQQYTVEPVKQKYLNIVLACLYTGKTPDQLEYAVRKGFLRVCVAKDKSRSFLQKDLDEYMGVIG
jgi:hypothetical protein